MTRDEIIRMAREAGFPFTKYGTLECDEDGEIDADEMFERFAALVAAAEREACAKVCEKISDEYDENEGLKYAELRTDAATGGRDCAAAIRARGEKGQS